MGSSTSNPEPDPNTRVNTVIRAKGGTSVENSKAIVKVARNLNSDGEGSYEDRDQQQELEQRNEGQF